MARSYTIVHVVIGEPHHAPVVKSDVVMITCPNTGRAVSTGIETDAKSLQAAWTGTMKVDCPHCHAAHDISVRDTYIEAVAQDDSDRLYRFR